MDRIKRSLVILSIVVAVVGSGMAYLFSRIDLLPLQASTEMDAIDSLLKLMFSIASIIFTLVVVFFIHSLIASRHSSEAATGPAWKGINSLEIAWTIIPLIIVVSLGTYGGIVLNSFNHVPPQNTELKVEVLAFQWGWQFSYPEYGVKSFELQIPVERPILFVINSKDVVHSFWVPEWGPKQDAVPGMTTELRLRLNTIGKYTVYCAELCGRGHTNMTAPAAIVSANDFQSWVEQQQKSAQSQPKSSPTLSPTGTPSSGTIDLTAKDMAFNMDTITVSAGADVTINFDNQDNISHNFAVYTDSSAKTAIFQGEIINQQKTTYKFKAPDKPGTYFFRCDVHPTTMTGKFMVK